MKGSIIKIWCIIDGYTGDTLNEYIDYKDAKAALKYHYDASVGDYIKCGLLYENGDYGSPVYFGEQLTGAKPQAWPLFSGGLVRPVWTSGRGRFCSNCDHTRDVCAVLDALRVKYETGNDAPRGGLTGNFVKIITKIEL